jgi:hypothetical protein
MLVISRPAAVVKGSGPGWLVGPNRVPYLEYYQQDRAIDWHDGHKPTGRSVANRLVGRYFRHLFARIPMSLPLRDLVELISVINATF